MGEIPQQTRQDIIEYMIIAKIDWFGRLDEVDFLRRIYDLDSLPSHDYRFENAAGDIYQHRINNDDWDDDWILDDPRFNLRKCPTSEFLRFLCAIVHPRVQPDLNQALRLVQEFNDQLRHTGWQLMKSGEIAERPCFKAKPISITDEHLMPNSDEAAKALESEEMAKQIRKMREYIDTDPAEAIGKAKEYVESCCKSILAQSGRGTTEYNKLDIKNLNKMVAEDLKLVPKDIADQVKGSKSIKKILGSLSAIVQGLAELRNDYGTGHGRENKFRGLQPRHARLAVGSAITYVEFLTKTYEYHNNEQ